MRARHYLGAVAGSAALVLTFASPAGATLTGDYNTSGVNIRSTPNGTILGQGNPGDGVRIDCTSTVSGVLWYHHRNVATQVLGYSQASLINRQAGPLPTC